MSQLSAKETADIRQLLIEKHCLAIEERITKVEFLDEHGRIIVYFHVYDSWKPPQPPEEKVEYLLHISEQGDTRVMPFKTEQRLKSAFDSFKMLNLYTLAATVNGEIRWNFTPK